MDFKDRFKAMVRTATPLVMINTFDPKATIRHVTEALDEAKDGQGKALLSSTGLSQWDIVNSLRGVNDLGKDHVSKLLSTAGSTIEALAVAAELYRVMQQIPEDSFVFVLNAHKFWSEAGEMQGIWNLRDTLKYKGSMLLLLSAPGSTLPPEIAQDVMVLEEPLPTPEQVEEIVAKAYESAKKLTPSIPNKLPADVMTKAKAALTGLPVFPAETATQQCLNAATGELDTKELWSQKRQIVSQRAGLSIYDGTSTLKNIAGVDNAVKFLQQFDKGPNSPNIVLRFDEMEKAFAGSGTDLSGDTTKLTGAILTWFQDKRINGIIFLGVPGCCKSELLYAWANDAGKPVINVDLPGMQGSLLGESMANLQAAQKTIDSIGGSRVLAIATVNDVSTIPAPLLRRFNLATFFFDLPETDEARQNILAIHRRKYGVNVKDAVPDMHLWTGSDIENCCQKARDLQISLKEAAGYVVPVMRARKDEMDALRRNAGGRYISASKFGVYEYFDPNQTMVQAVPDGGRRLKG